MAYLTINGKLLKVDGKYVTVSESSGASGEPQSKVVTPSHETQTVTADSGYYLSSVTVEAINLQVKHAVPTKEVQGITYDSPYNGLITVYVEPIPDQYIIPSGTSIIDENGEFSVKTYDTVIVEVPTVAPYYLDDTNDISQITDIPLSRFTPTTPAPKVGDYAINARGYLYKVIKIDSDSGDYSLNLVDHFDICRELNLDSKLVTPTKSVQNITYDSGYDGLLTVTVNPIPDEYIIPTGMVRRTVNGIFDVTNYSQVEIVVPTLDTSDATATAEDIASGKTAYVNGEKITGTATGSSSGSGSNATFSFDVATATLTITEG